MRSKLSLKRISVAILTIALCLPGSVAAKSGDAAKGDGKYGSYFPPVLVHPVWGFPGLNYFKAYSLFFVDPYAWRWSTHRLER